MISNFKYLASVFLVAFGLLIPIHGMAWGERGHHLVCEVATRSVENIALKNFLSSRGHIMGHLCNVPDIYWKSLGAPAKIGDAAHFLDPEHGNVHLADIVNDLHGYLNKSKFPADITTEDKANRMGTLFWRAEQIYKLSVTSGAKIASSPFPAKTEEQEATLSYNQNVYEFMVKLGLMGHFFGDASMPFHTTSDYDGWDVGHGGIHSFYETQCVNFYDLDLVGEVYKKAHELQKTPATSADTFSAIKEVAVTSAAEKAEVLNLDKVLENSRTDQKGVKVYAKRDKYEVACPVFKDKIVLQMARAALALARDWDRSYSESGAPNLSKYKLYLYPFTPDFIGMDYLKAPTAISLSSSFDL